jgi:excisionase family DNA binding protein
VTTDEVLTIKEVAALLKLAEKTVYLMAQGGEIPAFKARGQWRVRRSDLDAWIESQTGGAWQRAPESEMRAPEQVVGKKPARKGRR